MEAAEREETTLRLFLLGGFRAERAEIAVPESAWQRPQARMLVKLLATTPGHRLHREEIMDLLWSDADFQAARRSLNKIVHLARHALEPALERGGESSYLHLRDDLLQLDPRTVWIDITAFQGAADAALASGDPLELEAALALYGGELLPEDRYADWATPRREALADQYLRLLTAAADELDRAGAWERAAVRLQEALQLDPTREDLHRRLMRLYAARGYRHLALRQYQACVQTLQRELDTEPDEETQTLYEEILSRRGGHATSVLPESPAARAQLPPLPAPARRLMQRRLIGREQALDVLRDQIRDASDGAGTLVLVGGEAGVGKSRLAAQLAFEAHAEGARVLWGAGYELEGPLPYAPFAEALQEHLMSLPPAEAQTILVAYPDLRPLLPWIVGELQETPAAPGDRTRLFASVVRLLAGLADRPLVLVLDDVHTGDAETFQLLHHVARLAHGHRWLIVGTYREEDVAAGSAFQQFSAAATREGLCRRLDLRRLAREASDRLVVELLPDGVADPSVLAYLYGLSLGNPLFLQELVQSMREEGSLVLSRGHWHRPVERGAVVPSQVRELVEARVGRMDEGVRKVLALAAVAGIESSFTVLAHAAARVYSPPIAEPEVLDALDDALEAHILDEAGEGYAFRHPLLRETLYERLSRTRRTRLHAAIGEAIERERPEDVEALAHHFSLGGREGRAIEHLERAGDRARSAYANEIAASHYRTLLPLLDAPHRSLDAARVREKLGAVLMLLTRHGEALEALDEAARCYREAGDVGAESRVAGQIARVLGLQGRPEEGLERVQAMLRSLDEEAAGAAAAPLYMAVAWLRFSRGDRMEVLAPVQRAAELARGTSDTRLQAEALTWYARALLDAGETERGEEVMREAIAVAEAGGHDYELATAITHLGIFRRELASAIRAFERALAIAERAGDVDAGAFLLATLGDRTATGGDWEGGRAYLERAVTSARAVGSTYHSAYPFATLGRLLVAEGRWPEAETLMAEAERIAQPAVNLDVLFLVLRGRLQLALLSGCPEAALQHLAAAREVPRFRDALFAASLPEEAWALCLLGRVEQAEQVAVTVLESANRRKWTRLRIETLWVHALVLARLGRWQDAERCFEEDGELARAFPYPYEEGRALYEHGRLLMERDEVEDGRARMETALAIFERLGAQPYIERARRALGRSTTTGTSVG